MKELSHNLLSLISNMQSIHIALVFTPIPAPEMAILEYPFSFIREDGNGWSANDFSDGLLGDEKCDAGKFPNNITEFYWVSEGCNDEAPWELLCKLDNGNYAFYSAWCDYTGFDCQGGMKLIVSQDKTRLFYEGLTESQRAKCLADMAAPSTQ